MLVTKLDIHQPAPPQLLAVKPSFPSIPGGMRVHADADPVQVAPKTALGDGSSRVTAPSSPNRPLTPIRGLGRGCRRSAWGVVEYDYSVAALRYVDDVRRNPSSQCDADQARIFAFWASNSASVRTP